MSDKTAVVFGMGGQDSFYLAELLLSKGYKVIGVVRRSSQPRNYLIPIVEKGVVLVEGDITDFSSVEQIVKKYAPDHIYNLAAQSHVATSFAQPLYTWDVTAKGVLNILEIVRTINPSIRVYQASSSEMFGKSVSTVMKPVYHNDGTEVVFEKYQDEKTEFLPQSPYAIAKLAAHQAVRLYRESYGIFACAGILFNHESERRGENFVTRKITKYVGQLAVASDKASEDAEYHGDHDIYEEFLKTFPKLKLGNLSACRDWSHAEDMVTAMVMMLEAEKPNDYVVGSGETYSVEQFVEAAFKQINMNWKDYVEIDQALIRPAEVDYLRANPEKIKRELGWQPKLDFEGLVHRMVQYDTKRAAVKSSLYGRV